MPSPSDQTLAEALESAAAAGDGLRRARGLEVASRPDGASVERALAALGGDERDITETALAARAGQERATERLVAAALPVVRGMARRYAGPGVGQADLIQEGVAGLLVALRRYDPARGVPFLAYARWWIRQAMQQAVAEQSRAVRLPTHVLWDLHDLKGARERLMGELEREPSDRELARRLDWSEGRVAGVLAAERPAVALEPAQSGDERAVTRFGEAVDYADDNLDEVITRTTAEAVRALLATLTARELEVLRWRYGLDGAPELSLRQIGRRLGVSAERVRQIEERAVAKLRAGALSGR